MKTRYDAEANAKVIAPATRAARGAIRRVAIRITKGALWALEGHRYEGKVEPLDAPVFPGVGFHSRPRTTSQAEAIVLSVGDAQHPVIVATRDEDLRRLWKAELDAGVNVAAMFNSATIIMCKADGTVEIKARGGEAKSLAFKSDLQSVDEKYATHVHLSPAGATNGPLSTTIPNLPNPLYPATDPINPYLTVVGAIPTTNPDSAGPGLAPAAIAGTSVLLGQ